MPNDPLHPPNPITFRCLLCETIYSVDSHHVGESVVKHWATVPVEQRISICPDCMEREMAKHRVEAYLHRDSPDRSDFPTAEAALQYYLLQFGRRAGDDAE